MTSTPRITVITGASSGLGRETAYQLAAQGERVVLAARRVDELERAAQVCRELGGEALVVGTDVTREDDVIRLAGAALDHWGRIDAWINNAAVAFFARLEEGLVEDHRRVIETNLHGAIHGARAVAPIFRRQRRGVLVNVGSVLSKIGHPFVPSYVISKFGLHGLSEALRVELADFPDVHVCTLFPHAIDTPHFQTAANALGRKAWAVPPMQSPEVVARALIDLLDRPRRQRMVPRSISLALALHWMLPRTTERLLLRGLQAFHLGEGEDRTRRGLYEPSREVAAVHGRRPPRVGPVGLAAWIARELVRIEGDVLRHRVQRWRALAMTS